MPRLRNAPHRGAPQELPDSLGHLLSPLYHPLCLPAHPGGEQGGRGGSKDKKTNDQSNVEGVPVPNDRAGAFSPWVGRKENKHSKSWPISSWA